MTIRQKILVVVGLTFLCVAAVLYGVTRGIVLGSFARLEERGVQTNVKRVRDAIGEELSSLGAMAKDWAAWDDTRDFVLHRTPSYKEGNLTNVALVNIRLNFMVFVDLEGEIVHSIAVDLEEEVETSATAALLAHITGHEQLLSHRDARDGKTGIVLLPEGHALLAAWPISGNNYVGAVNGTFVIGRYLNDRGRQRLEDMTHLAINLSPIEGASDAGEGKSATPAQSGWDESPVTIEETDADTIFGYLDLPDVYGTPCLNLRVDVPRDVLQHGEASVRYFLLVLLVVGILVFVALLVSLQAIVLGPLGRLTEHVVAIGRSGRLSDRLEVGSSDEIGTLSREFNDALREIADARNRLLEQSYHSGLAEMAGDVVHNVRNSLAPVVATVAGLREKHVGSAAENVEKAVAELGSGECPDERRQALERYMLLGGAQLAALSHETCKDLGEISDGLRRIDEILIVQDEFSHADRASESVDLFEVASEAADAVPEALRDKLNADHNATIEIDPAMSSLPRIRAERVVLRLALVSLLRNAVESVLRADRRPGKIHVGAAVKDCGEGRRVVVEIADNGVGMDADDLERIFNRGSSSREGAPSATGLHWCANVMTGMNGSIQADSEGPNRGARFRLKMPVGS